MAEPGRDGAAGAKKKKKAVQVPRQPLPISSLHGYRG